MIKRGVGHIGGLSIEVGPKPTEHYVSTIHVPKLSFFCQYLKRFSSSVQGQLQVFVFLFI